MYRTDDYGETWTKIVNGIGERDFARAIREDTKRAKELYLGTEHGIYISFDDGANWQSLKQNLPDTPVHDIKVEERDLVIATHGRAFYVMDDIAPLRQWGVQSTSNLHLFKPNDVLRGLDRALAFDYSLKQAAEKVSVELLDSKGKRDPHLHQHRRRGERRQVAGRHTGAGRRRVQSAAGTQTAGERRAASHELGSALSGCGRFPGDDHVGRQHARADRAARELSGAHHRRRRHGNASRSRSNANRTCLADVSDADLQKQFDLAMQIRNKTTEANEAVLLVRGIKPQIKDRASKLDAKAGPTAKALDDLEKSLSTVEGEIYQVKLQSGQDPLNYPIKLNNKIAALQGVVESADTQPTDQSYEVFKLLSDRLTTQLSTLDSTVKTKLPKVNQMLQKQKLAPIEAKPLDPKADKDKTEVGAAMKSFGSAVAVLVLLLGGVALAYSQWSHAIDEGDEALAAGRLDAARRELRACPGSGSTRFPRPSSCSPPITITRSPTSCRRGTASAASTR